MSITIDKYIIITLIYNFNYINNSRVNNHYPCHPYMPITENYSSKLTIMPFWIPAFKFSSKNSILKKSLDLWIRR